MLSRQVPSRYRLKRAGLALAVFFVLFPAIGAAPANATTVPVLVAHWKMDEATAGINAVDDVGGNDGTPGTQSSTYPTPSAVVPPVAFTNSGSMSFNGQNYFTINNPVSTNFTICAWVKTSSTGGGVNHWTSAPIMDAEWGGVNYDFGFGVGNGGKLMFGNGGVPVGGGGLFDAQVNGATTINDNAWHNVCATRNNTTGAVRLYVDATLDGSGTTGVGALNVRSTARIGWGYDGAALYQGLIDDVRVYDTDLTVQQLQNLASGSNSPNAPVVSISAPVASSSISSWNPSVNWGSSDECSYSWDNSTWHSVTCASNGSDIPVPANGSGVVLYVRGNATGDTSYGTASKTFTFDNTAPTVDAGSNQHVGAAFTISGASANDAVSGLANVTWSKVSGPGVVTFSNVHATNSAVSSMSQDGTYVLRLSAVDNLGNSSSDDVTVIWDTTKPVITWNAGGFPDATTTQTNATFGFSGTDALSGPVVYQCKLDALSFVSCTSPTSLDKLAQGNHSFTVRAADSVGNSDDLTYAWVVNADQTNDRNGDGVVDVLQQNVTGFTSGVTQKQVALEVDSSCEVAKAAVESEDSYGVGDLGFNYPQGLFDFTVNCGAAGFTTKVTQYYYDVLPSQLTLRKYNPITKTYSAVNAATIATHNVYGRSVTSVTYEVTDGGALDADGVANGVIVDPAGLATPVVNASAPTNLAKTGLELMHWLMLGVGMCAFGAFLLSLRRRW